MPLRLEPRCLVGVLGMEKPQGWQCPSHLHALFLYYLTISPANTSADGGETAFLKPS